MPEHTLKERLKNTTNLTSSADRIAALDAAEQSSAAVEAVVEPQVVKEQIGIGEPAHDSVEAAELAQLLRKIKALKGKPKIQAPLIERVAGIRAAALARLAAEKE